MEFKEIFVDLRIQLPRMRISSVRTELLVRSVQWRQVRVDSVVPVKRSERTRQHQQQRGRCPLPSCWCVAVYGCSYWCCLPSLQATA